ncbi:nuclear pore complex protein NUP98A-like [Carica papaya]|uniref:nuclear pore complex protein NUP98A-like n=1 Tax=Carica papaya TaxID=3649 RepID=UPI000B8CBEDF|nr:nuclear pore complex protein NUP98A-like [Carica papaya]
MQIDEPAATPGKNEEPVSFGCSKIKKQIPFVFSPPNNTTLFGTTNGASSSVSFSPLFASSGDSIPAFGCGLKLPTTHPLNPSPQPFKNSPNPFSSFSSSSFPSSFNSGCTSFDFSATPLHCFSNIPQLQTPKWGTKLAAYSPTIDPNHNQSLTGNCSFLFSISAMPAYGNKTHEELRWEDHQTQPRAAVSLQWPQMGALGFPVLSGAGGWGNSLPPFAVVPLLPQPPTTFFGLTPLNPSRYTPSNVSWSITFSPSLSF